MGNAALKAELTTEGDSFMEKYGHDGPDETFGADITRVFNQSTGFEWAEERVSKAFAVMHGYLNNAYIGGWWEEGDPEWAHSRHSSWSRWVRYLCVVDGFSSHRAAQTFASHLFYAVDEISPYS